MHLQRTLFAFKNPESRSSATSYTPNTKNKWANYNEYMVVIEEKECEENNIRES
jgi:hypothetical protein